MCNWKSSVWLLGVLVLCGPAQAQKVDGITATPAALAFTYQLGSGKIPAEQKVQVKRAITGSALDFTVTVDAGSPWLIVTPMAGKTGASISARVNPTSMLAGTYPAVITITSPTITNPTYVNVTLSTKAPPANPSIKPGGIATNFQTDQPVPADTTMEISSDGAPISFTAVASGGTWLSVTPNIGIAVAGSPVTLTVKQDVTGLIPATYSGKITLTFTNASSKSLAVPVVLTVSPGRGVITTIWPTGAPLGSDDATITLRGRHFFSKSMVQAGTTTLSATWVSTDVMMALIPKALLAVQGPLNITVTNAPQTASDPAVFQVRAPGPNIDAVVNAASFAGTTPTPTIAPGEIITIFGSGLGPSTLLQNDPVAGVYPSTLGTPATLVEFELTANTWTLAPIIFTQANQINAVAPFALTVGQGKRMRVTYNLIASNIITFDAVEAAPGIFTTDSSGQGQGAILNYNETTGAYTLNSASNAAPKGSIVVLYITGGGAFVPVQAVEGQVIPLTGTLPVLLNAASVTINGDGATVQSATASPGSIAGLVQLNVTVPDTIKAGKNLPLVVTIAGHSSTATATVAVK